MPDDGDSGRRFIRPIAICVFWKRGRILVFKGRDSVEGDDFYRPLGGGIEFGEHSEDAIVREIHEELGAAVQNVRLLGTLENIFTLEGETGHEFVQVYDAEFVDRSLYERDWLDGYEEDEGPFEAYWKRLDDFDNGLGRLVPEGLLQLLRGVA